MLNAVHVEGHTFLVTGGASGLGAACVRMILEQGGRVVIADLQSPKKELGGSCQFVATDVRRADEVEAALAATVQLAGTDGLRGVIQCAGVAPAQRVVGKDGQPHALDSFERVIGVNLIGTFNVARLAAAAMAQNRPLEDGERGVIVHTASVAAFEGQVGQAAYAASKGGVVSMTLPLARELARHGIRVVTIAPGIFETPMMDSMPENVRQSLAATVPFPQRLGRAQEFAELARHIIENRMLNGSTIRLDGALRMAGR